MNKIFLGGTTPSSMPLYGWRGDLISGIKVDYFNPVVEDWTEDCIDEENKQKELCNIHLYVITNEMKGVYSIAEAVQSSNIKGKSTIFHVIPEGFDDGQLRSLKAVCNLIRKNGGMAYVNSDIKNTVQVLNFCFE